MEWFSLNGAAKGMCECFWWYRTNEKDCVQFKLRGSLVLLKLLVPIDLGERGEYTSNRTPFRDTQPGLRQTGYTTNDYNREDENRAPNQPPPDRRRRKDR